MSSYSDQEWCLDETDMPLQAAEDVQTSDVEPRYQAEEDQKLVQNEENELQLMNQKTCRWENSC